MKLLDMTHGRHTYSVELSYSPLFESVLGIAAMTYTEIHPTLEKSPSYWEELALSLPLQLREDLLYAQTFNTWKTLLQLLHEQSFADLDAFLDYIPSSTGVGTLCRICATTSASVTCSSASRESWIRCVKRAGTACFTSSGST